MSVATDPLAISAPRAGPAADRLQPAEETVLLIVDPGGEVEEEVEVEEIGGVR